jgi:hypothetical protein
MNPKRSVTLPIYNLDALSELLFCQVGDLQSRSLLGQNVPIAFITRCRDRRGAHRRLIWKSPVSFPRTEVEELDDPEMWPA